MPITGTIKFFEQSSSLSKKNGQAVATSGTTSADLMLNMNRSVRWDSVGSDDATTETVTITFPARKIDRLFLLNHNLKDFSITYGSTPVSFSNVVGIDGVLTGIVETDFNQDTSYYEFDAVTTDQINITANTTQIADQEKFITSFLTTNEIGTLEGYPKVNSKLDNQERRSKVLTGRFITQKSFEIFNATLNLENTSQNDIDIFEFLYDSQEPFLIWLCGGHYGKQNFSVKFKNWRLKDVYQVQTSGSIKTNFRSNVYILNPITGLRLTEEV